MLKVIENIEELSSDARDLISIELYKGGFSSYDGSCGRVFFYDKVEERPVPENEYYDCYLDINIHPSHLGFPEHEICAVEWFNK